ncbi:MAG: bifunctional UDP-N-acetylglucosamine diphosphorylase/glucosamine-1-phosphate N-acetyltransferase GlmU [Candidatus Humimicrobiaceae bacterium]
MEYIKNLNIVVLAAGFGKRMISSIPKVLHKIIDKPMIYYILQEAIKLNPSNIYVVTGHEHEILESYLADNFPQIIPVYQEVQAGTGHAVSLIKKYYNKDMESLMVLTGDCPLIKIETLKKLSEIQKSGNYACTVLSAVLENPFGYGRIVKNKSGEMVKIVEEADATLQEKLIKEINTSVYCFNAKDLFENISSLDSKNNQKEFYLTDIVEKFTKNSLKTFVFLTDDNSEAAGVNDRVQLSAVEKIMRSRINEKFQCAGVTITDPDSTFIGTDVEIESDVAIEPFSFINGKTLIKKDCIIGPFAQITDCEIDSGTKINSAVIKNAKIGKNNNIGPFSYIRPGTITSGEVKVGGFCEVKNSIVGSNSKIPHLSYIGDCEIGQNVNIGASSVTCNYDGYRKNRTEIDDDVFIGSDTMLVPPVKVGKRSIVAAGSVITEDVPEDAMAVSRGRQINMPEGAIKYREKKERPK